MRKLFGFLILIAILATWNITRIVQKDAVFLTESIKYTAVWKNRIQDEFSTIEAKNIGDDFPDKIVELLPKDFTDELLAYASLKKVVDISAFHFGVIQEGGFLEYLTEEKSALVDKQHGLKEEITSFEETLTELLEKDKRKKASLTSKIKAKQVYIDTLQEKVDELDKFLKKEKTITVLAEKDRKALFSHLEMIIPESKEFSEEDKSILATLLLRAHIKAYPVTTEKLPKDLVWETSVDEPFASDKAKKGGTWNRYFTTYPLTLRQVGPESNGSFRSELDDHTMRLIDLHPVTDKPHPALATHWYIAKDNKTVYFKLDPDARWSDGHAVIADDIMFKLESLRSKHSSDPFGSNYANRFFEEILKFDDHTIAVRLKVEQPEPIFTTNLDAKPRHFYRNLEEDYQFAHDWVVVPRTGAYQISSLNKGKDVTFSRDKNWWAQDKKFFKNRFNPDTIYIRLIRSTVLAFEYFKKAKIDMYNMSQAEYWHNKSKDVPEFKNGYITKLWFYNYCQRPLRLASMNVQKPLLKELDIRRGIAHSLNMQKVIDVLMRGEANRLNNISEGYGEYTNTEVRPFAYDSTKAIKFFEKAGFDKVGEDGVRMRGTERLSVELLYPNAHEKTWVVMIKEDAKKTGLEIRLKNYDPNTSFQKMLKKEHEMAWHGWAPSHRPRYWGSFHGDNAKAQTTNFSNMNEPKINEMIEKFRESVSVDERIRLSNEIQVLIRDHASSVTTYTRPYFRQGFWKWLKTPEGYALKSSASLADYHVFWIDEELKKQTLEDRKAGKVFEAKTIIEKKYLLD